MMGRGRGSARARSNTGERLRSRRCARRWLATLGLVIAGLLVSSAPAFGLGAKGHTFSFAFGGAGSGPGQFSGPTQVAVWETAKEGIGNVYVLDNGNSRVQRFTCTASSCTFASEFHVEGGISIAVNKAGTAFVATEEGVIDRFNAKDEELPPLKGFKEEGAGAPLEEYGEIHGVALDAEGHLYVYREANILQVAGTKLVREISIETSCTNETAFAVAPAGNIFYVGTERENTVGECEEIPVVASLDETGRALSRYITGEETTGVAVEASSGNVYLDNVSSIGEFSPEGSLLQRFGEGHLTGGAGLAASAKAASVYAVEPAANEVKVFGPEAAGAPTIDSLSSQALSPTSERLNALIDPHGTDTHAYFEYGTEDCSLPSKPCTSKPAPPGKDLGAGFGDTLFSEEVTELQPGTAYHFRVIASYPCVSGTCTVEAAGVLNTLPSAAGLLADNRRWELVSPPDKGGAGIEPIGGVAANGGPSGGVMQASENGNAITYVANAPVVNEPEGSRSPEGTQVLSTRSSTAWSTQDIVTPHTSGEGFPAGNPQEYRFFSSDLSLALLAPFGSHKYQEPRLAPEPPGEGKEERGLDLRHDATCQATPATCYQALVTKENDPVKEAFGGFGGLLEFLTATPDMSHIVFGSKVGLTSGSLAEGGLYEWEAGSLRLISVLPNGEPAEGRPAEEIAPGLGFSNGVSANYRHALSNDGTRAFWENSERDRLYMREVKEGTAKTVQVNAAEPPLEEPEEEEPEHDETVFQIASTDGSKSFFTDNARLTEEAPPRATFSNSPSDLYVFDANAKTHPLTDITAHSTGGPADVLGTVMGASEDGSYVYFVANGVLATGAQHGDCRTSVGGAETCNLYVSHLSGGKWETKFIAALSRQDEPDWLAKAELQLGAMTSRASPHGTFLAFMSDRPLTGYENVDANPAANGARDEEVFLYDATAGPNGHLTCVSCKAGSVPHGVLDQEHSGEGHGLLVDRRAIWEGRWLAGNIPGWTNLNLNTAPYQSRYLSDEGRLYFNSPEALVEKDENGKEDVYQYAPAGVGSCQQSAGCVSLISSGTSERESAFIDATPSSSDVFFITEAQLVTSDLDHSFDLYDARVCTEGSPCITPPPPPPPPCASEGACRPPQTQQTGFGSPLGSTVAGPGNTGQSETAGQITKKPPTKKPLTKAQKLAKALTACRKTYKHKKKKRVACERRARHTYGKKAPKHAAKHASRGK